MIRREAPSPGSSRRIAVSSPPGRRKQNNIEMEDVKMVREGGFEPPRLSAPPPQDGVSASSTTSALRLNRPIAHDEPTGPEG